MKIIQNLTTYLIGSISIFLLCVGIYAMFTNDVKMFVISFIMGMFFTFFYLIMESSLRKEGRK